MAAHTAVCFLRGPQGHLWALGGIGSRMAVNGSINESTIMPLIDLIPSVCAFMSWPGMSSIDWWGQPRAGGGR